MTKKPYRVEWQRADEISHWSPTRRRFTDATTALVFATRMVVEMPGVARARVVGPRNSIAGTVSK
jgi:hypothetical protein